MSQNPENQFRVQPSSQPTNSFCQEMGTTETTRPRLERPKVDQLALNFGFRSAETTTDTSSSSHFHTSQSSVAEDENANTNDRDSVYTYRSDLDASRYLRQVSGRVSMLVNLVSTVPRLLTILISYYVLCAMAFEGIQYTKRRMVPSVR